MKTMMMITIAVLMTMTMAKSDETKTITPKEFQKAGWAEMKTKWPWNKIFKSEAQ